MPSKLTSSEDVSSTQNNEKQKSEEVDMSKIPLLAGQYVVKDFVEQEPADAPPTDAAPRPELPPELETPPEKPKLKMQLGPEGKKNLKKALIGLVVLAVVGLLAGGGVWGYVQYDRYFRVVPLEQLLPKDANVVATITIDPQSDQYKYLEENLQKFPAYDLLRKGLNKEGEDKSVSQLIQDKLSREGLDFQKDITPALGEKAYVVIPDLTPIKDELERGFFFVKRESQEVLAEVLWNDEQRKTMTAVFGQGENPNVMGTIDAAAPPETKKENSKVLHLVAGAEIEDLTKAKEVLDKLKGDNRYEISEQNYKGYVYFKIKQKPDSKDKEKENEKKGGYTPRVSQPEKNPFSYDASYSALIGKNFIMATREEEIKAAVDRKGNHTLIKDLFAKEDKVSLAGDENHKTITSNLERDKGSSILEIYYKINFQKFFTNDDCASCEDISDYVKYPDDVTGGWSIRFDEEGIMLRTASNQYVIKESQNRPISESLTNKIPQKAGGKWVDLFMEYTSPKDYYHNFKSENLTEKGRLELEDRIAEMEEKTKINLEKDIIDQLTGNTSFIGVTKPDDYPEGAMVAEINDPAKALETIRTLTDYVRNEALEYYELYSANIVPREGASESEKQYWEERNREQQEAYNAVKEAKLRETVTPDGTIYSFKLPMYGFSFSFDFSFADNTLILGSHYAVVESVLKEVKQNTEPKLAKNDYYLQASKYAYEQGYGRGFLHTAGVWNVIDYYVDKEIQQRQERRSQDPVYGNYYDDDYDQEIRNMAYGIGGVVRTFKFFYGSANAKDHLADSSLFVKIQELPKEEKDRANKAIRIMAGEEEVPAGEDSSSAPGMPGAREKANRASLISIMSSVTTTAAVCVHEDGSVLEPNSKISGGGPICSLADIDEEWPALPTEVVNEGYQYGTASNTKLTAANGTNEVSCDVATSGCRFVTTDDGNSFGQDTPEVVPDPQMTEDERNLFEAPGE